uniref:Uncharacterized protein n=2 Tax=Ralstonia solanacearum TaxID=305 RepID=A0A0S4X1R1_RALSL|nr:protein of unknown function [Ralstonia solanacearum]
MNDMTAIRANGMAAMKAIAQNLVITIMIAITAS